jgi:hypothetical protein
MRLMPTSMMGVPNEPNMMPPLSFKGLPAQKLGWI